MNSILETLSDIIATPLRSLLTVTGIVVGIAAVIVVISIGDGNRIAIQEKIKAMGANLMAINMAGVENEVNTFSSGAPIFIDERRIEGMQQAIPSIKAISPVLTLTSSVSYRDQHNQLNTSGVYANYPIIRNLQLEAGRFFTSLEDKNIRFVALLSRSAADKLGISSLDVGRVELRINGKNHTLIGITKDLSSIDSNISPLQLYIPFHRLTQDWPNIPFFDVYLTIDKAFNVEDVSAQIRRYLSRHYGKSSTAWLKGMADILRAEKAITTQTTMIIIGIASLSLFVGGIGIMNIMLVTVKEKTREIGIRKAVGASNQDILLQFLSEGVVLCVVGGTIGVILGILISYIVASFLALPIQISPYAVAIALGFSCIVGIFFSLYPALDAAKLSPVEALRYE